MGKPKIIGAKTTLLQYWQATRQYPWDVAKVLLLPLSSVLLFVLLPLLSSHILADLISSHRQQIWQLFWLAVVSAVAGMLLNTVGIRASMSLQSNAMDNLYQHVYKHLMQRSVGFFNNQIGGKLVSDVNDYVQGYMMLFNTAIIGMFTFAVTVIIGLVVIFVNSMVLGGLLVLLLGGLVWWTRSENKRRFMLRHQRLEINKNLISHLSDSLVNAITVKTFANEQQEYATAQSISEDLRSARVRDWHRAVTNESSRLGVLFIAELALVGGLIIITAHDPSVLATGIFAFTYTINLLGRFFSINNMSRQMEEALLQAQPMTQRLTELPEIQDAPDAQPLTVQQGAIDFNNVSFRYADGTTDVFADLDLQIKAGEKVGLVGHSGGGKSTLTRLLLRFDDLTTGSISIDGQNLAEVTQVSLRDQIAYVPQEPLLFHRTIRENIAYGKPDASLKAIKQAAAKASASEFIEQLPHGYDTIVGERGVKLSGGQRQRVAIARAILKNAPILVLDEATSALDSESEKAIQTALWELMEGKTALVIAHRLSTIQKLDRIIVLDDGRIVEQGSHRELLAHNGVYAKLWQHQSGGFIEE